MSLLSGKMGAFIGGAAKRGSELIQEEREAAYNLIDTNMTDWTRLGVPMIKERKKLRTSMKTTAESLKSKGFSNDQIAVALYQGKQDEVLKHVEALEAASKDNPDLQYNPADIIKFGPDYQASGLTMDQILDGVLGKVSSGMSTADALADMGGSGLQRAFMENRAEAAAAASGFDIGTLKAIATGDLEYGQAPEGGVITMVDPLASAQAKTALAGGETGTFTAPSATSTLVQYGNKITGAGRINAGAGVILYEHEQAERGIQIENKVAEMLAAKQQEVGRNRLTLTEMNEVKTELRTWAETSGLYVGPVKANGNGNKVNEFDFSAEEDAGSIAAAYKKAIEGQDDATVQKAFDAAKEAALEYFKKNSPDDATAAKKLEEWTKSLQTGATTVTADITPVQAASNLKKAKTPEEYERLLAIYMEVTGRDDVDNIKRTMPPPAS